MDKQHYKPRGRDAFLILGVNCLFNTIPRELISISYWLMQTNCAKCFLSDGNWFLQELMGIKASHLHAREKRASESHFIYITRMYWLHQWNLTILRACVLLTTECFFVTEWLSSCLLFHIFPASNSSEYVIQAVVTSSDLERLQALLSSLSFPLLINNTAQITSINTTTGTATSFHFITLLFAGRQIFQPCRYARHYKMSMLRCLLAQCVHQTAPDTSAGASRASPGRSTAASARGPATPSLGTRVGASMGFQPTASTASWTPVNRVGRETSAHSAHVNTRRDVDYLRGEKQKNMLILYL